MSFLEKKNEIKVPHPILLQPDKAELYTDTFCLEKERFQLVD